MRKAIVSAAGPRFADLLALSSATYRRFASAHGYEVLMFGVDDRACVVEPSMRRRLRWHKVDLLRRLLPRWDLLVWIDADAAFCRWDRDISSEVPDDCYQALALESFGDRSNPNSGVWVLRNDDRSMRFLDAVSGTGQLHHSWADQATISHLLGWDLGDFHGHGAHLRTPTNFTRGTWWLPRSWNAVGERGDAPVYIRHLAGMSMKQRLERMERLVMGAE